MINLQEKGYSLAQLLFDNPVEFKSESKAKKCVVGYPCSRACISTNKNCRNKLNPGGESYNFAKWVTTHLSLGGNLTKQQLSKADETTGGSLSKLLATKDIPLPKTEDASTVSKKWDGLDIKQRLKIISKAEVKIPILQRSKLINSDFKTIADFIKDDKTKAKFLEEIKQDYYVPRVVLDKEKELERQRYIERKIKSDNLANDGESSHQRLYRDKTDNEIRAAIKNLEKQAEISSNKSINEVVNGHRYTARAGQSQYVVTANQIITSLENLLDQRKDYQKAIIQGGELPVTKAKDLALGESFYSYLTPDKNGNKTEYKYTREAKNEKGDLSDNRIIAQKVLPNGKLGDETVFDVSPTTLITKLKLEAKNKNDIQSMPLPKTEVKKEGNKGTNKQEPTPQIQPTQETKPPTTKEIIDSLPAFVNPDGRFKPADIKQAEDARKDFINNYLPKYLSDPQNANTFFLSNPDNKTKKELILNGLNAYQYRTVGQWKEDYIGSINTPKTDKDKKILADVLSTLGVNKFDKEGKIINQKAEKQPIKSPETLPAEWATLDTIDANLAQFNKSGYKEQSIKVDIPGGKIDIPAMVKGDVAVHLALVDKNVHDPYHSQALDAIRSYTVTHIPTGLSIATFSPRHQRRSQTTTQSARLAKRLADGLQNLDLKGTTFSNETINKISELFRTISSSRR